MKAVLIAGAGSGCGKTTVTLGLMAAFREKGLRVQGFKAGPDYIDPSLHRVVTGLPSINLDTWMMSEPFLRYSFASRAADISVIEGVMGLHDGRLPDSDEGSTAELAKRLGLPVILVVNAQSMARTAAAVIKGIREFDREVNIIGIILNKLGSGRHREILEKSIKEYCNLPVLGGVLRDAGLELPSRHLGLFMGEELPQEKIRLISVAAQIDLDKILELSYFCCPEPSPPFSEPVEDKGRVAVARDRAFCFYYQDNLDILEKLGYRLVEFSPLESSALPDNITAVYLGGGYPELYARELSENRPLLYALRSASLKGTDIYGECGGLIYLGESLTTVEGEEYAMSGCLPCRTRMRHKLKSLGYVEIRPRENHWVLNRDQPVRGHAFHYSDLEFTGSALPNIYTGEPENKAVGYRRGNTLASYVHLHFSGLLCYTDTAEI
ncbi:MAG: cobyrinate a,c-diamide synthase [bacterium]